jgi:Glycosyl transferases group 1
MAARLTLRSASMRRGRNLSMVRRPGAWQGLGYQLAWSLSGPRPAPLALSWPLAPADARAIRILWPARYGWQGTGRMLAPLRRGLEALVRVETADIPQPNHNMAVVRLLVDGRSTEVGIDYEDRPLLHESADALPLVFKMQHLREGYGRDSVVPGGYVAKSGIYRHHPALRRFGERRADKYELYGRFSLRYVPEIRRNAIARLEAQQRFRFEGGLKVVTWGEYMREVCRTQMCLDLPGRGPFTHRLIEYLAVGACVVGARHKTILHVPLEADRHIVYSREDFTDLVEVAARYLEDDGARARIAHNARDYFDRYLRPEQLAAYYLDRCLGAVRGA